MHNCCFLIAYCAACPASTASRKSLPIWPRGIFLPPWAKRKKRKDCCGNSPNGSNGNSMSVFPASTGYESKHVPTGPIIQKGGSFLWYIGMGTYFECGKRREGRGWRRSGSDNGKPCAPLPSG